ncbi:MAG TPA: class I SAM-dependent methyltransferase [Vicinamibacterales bacterium]|nr:class I SAM-dependent methyltransferase [Vicinamibacterales bacterium]
MSRRREGDAIAIPGDYQARALDSPRAAQRFWHAARLRLLERVAPPLRHARIADAGCGSGVIAAHAAKTAREVVGFDSNPAAIEFASQAFGTDRLRFVLGSFERLLDDGPFDQIYCLEVLEHLYEEQAIETLRLFARAAAPAAQLFVTTPNAHSLWPLIEWSLDRLDLVPTLDEAQHLTLFSRKKLRRAMAAAGWRVLELGTFNGVAPFVAPVSQALALGVERAEFAGRRFLPLNLLYCHATMSECATGAGQGL